MVSVKCRVRVGPGRCGLPAGHVGTHEPEGVDGVPWLRLRDVQRLGPLQPGDRLVLETDQPWTLAQMDEARETLRRFFRGQDVDVVILPPRSRIVIVPAGQEVDADGVRG